MRSSLPSRFVRFAASAAIAATLATGCALSAFADADADVTTGGVDQFVKQRAVDAQGQFVNSNTEDGCNFDLVAYKEQPLYPAVYTSDSAWQPSTSKGSGTWIEWGTWVTTESTTTTEGTGATASTGSGLWDDAAISNVVDQFTFVKNNSSDPVYFRTVIAVKSPTGFNDSLVHLNVNDLDSENNLNALGLFDWDASQSGRQDFSEAERISGATIDGTEYDLFVATYLDELPADATAQPSLLQVGMDKSAGNNDFALLGGTFDIKIVTQAISLSDGDESITDIEGALNAQFGEITASNHPWLPNEGTSTSAAAPSAAVLASASSTASGEPSYDPADLASLMPLNALTGSVSVEDGSLVLRGGTWPADPSAFVAEGFTATDNGNGTWTVSAAQ